jgi:hypothetical protein
MYIMSMSVEDICGVHRDAHREPVYSPSTYPPRTSASDVTKLGFLGSQRLNFGLKGTWRWPQATPTYCLYDHSKILVLHYIYHLDHGRTIVISPQTSQTST